MPPTITHIVTVPARLRLIALGAILFLISYLPLAHARYTQAGTDLVGSGSVGCTNLGSAVALSYDGSTALIGAWSDATNKGAVWVFTRPGPPSYWTQQGSKLTVPSGLVFGYSLALSSNGNTAAIVSEPLYPYTNGDGGTWIFTRSGTNWNLQAGLNITNYIGGTALSADGNTIAVGSPFANSNNGTVFIFTRSGTNWIQNGKVAGTILSGSVGSGQGLQVALSQNGNTLVSLDGPYGYIFTNQGGLWIQQTFITNGTTLIQNNKNPVALSGDGNVVAFGIPSANEVHVWQRNGTNWIPRDFLVALDLPGDAQGSSVSLSQDGTLLIYGDPAYASGTGMANVCRWDGTNYNSVDGYILNAAGLPNAQQGASAALSADGSAAFVGVPADTNLVGSVRPYVALAPLLVVQQPIGNNLTNNGANSFGTIIAGWPSVTQTLTITNAGNTNLNGLTITEDGPDAAIFNLLTNPVAPVTTNASTTFTVQFTPGPAFIGDSTATLHIASDDYNQRPYNLVLTGTYLTFTNDTGGDGMNDASKFLMSSLGFNWHSNQTSLVNTYYANANGAGLFTPAQVQALNSNAAPGAPVLAKDGTGLVKLTISLQNSTNLVNFGAFPMTATQTVINAQGQLEFRFAPTNNAAFLQLKAQ